MFILLLFLDSGREFKPITTDYVDLIEVNYQHDQYTGKQSYAQVICWEWSYDYRRMHVVGWYIADRLADYPTLTSQGDYLADKVVNGRRVRVRSTDLRITWTKNDPERLNKKVFPETYRKGLGRNAAVQSLLRDAWQRSNQEQ